MDKRDLDTARITKNVKGKKIKKVVVSHIKSADVNEEDAISKDMSDIYIILEDDTVLRCWNSEWGGLQYGKFERIFDDVDYIDFKTMGEVR